MGDHIIDGEFQSDKYPTCPRGKVPLSVKDKTAQDLLWEYAQRRRSVDAEFAADLETALVTAGYERAGWREPEPPAPPAPIDMVLFCPKCHQQHIDAPHGEWTNPPHRSHQCQHCGCIWRPADVPTNGVEAVVTRGTADTWDPEAATLAEAFAERLTKVRAVLAKHYLEAAPSHEDDGCWACACGAGKGHSSSEEAIAAWTRHVMEEVARG